VVLAAVSLATVVINTVAYFSLVHLSRRTGNWPNEQIEFESWQSESEEQNLPKILEATPRSIIHHDQNNLSNEANVNSFLKNSMDLSDDGSYADLETCSPKTAIVSQINQSIKDDADEEPAIGSFGSGPIDSINVVSVED